MKNKNEPRHLLTWFADLGLFETGSRCVTGTGQKRDNGQERSIHCAACSHTTLGSALFCPPASQFLSWEITSYAFFLLESLGPKKNPNKCPSPLPATSSVSLPYLLPVILFLYFCPSNIIPCLSVRTAENVIVFEATRKMDNLHV